MLSNRSLITDDDYFNRWFDRTEDYITYQNDIKVDLVLKNDLDFWMRGDFGALFGDKSVVEIEQGWNALHVLYLNPHYACFMNRVFGDNPYGLLFNYFIFPKMALRSKIEDFYKKEIAPFFSVGVHIRYISMAVGERYLPGGFVDIAHYASAAVFKAYLESNATKPLKIFLAADNEWTKNALENIFPRKIATWPENVNPDDDDKNSVIFDMFILSLTDRFVGTLGSSVTSFAQFRRLDHAFLLSHANVIAETEVYEAWWPSERVQSYFNVPFDVIKSAGGLYESVILKKFGLDFNVPEIRKDLQPKCSF